MSAGDGGRRFRPTRAGIVSLWDYGYEIFEFSGGRLALRGPNGSGKTKALELLFPFVFDARLDPRRLNPFSDEGRTMKQNLLYRGDTDTNHGYVWLELRRDAADGDSNGSDAHEGHDVRTIGAGMRAQRHRDEVTSWFFVTDRAIERGRRADQELSSNGDRDGSFDVVDGDRRPLTPRQLGEVIGTDNVYDRASEYRERLDRELFGLGRERYEALVHLTLFLRRPHLAMGLDTSRLSTILSEGLRPLDDELIDQASRSFNDLESAQRELERLGQAKDAVETFLRRYRAYLRVVARDRVGRVRAAESEARGAHRRRASAVRRVDEATSTLTEAAAQLGTVETHQAQARGEREALLTSDAYRAAQQLEDLASHAADSEHAAARLDEDVGAAEVAAAAAHDAEAEATAVLQEAETARDGHLERTGQESSAAGVDWSAPADTATPEDVRTSAVALVASREAEIAEVRGALAAAERAESQAADLEDRRAAAEQAADEAAATLRLSERQVELARDQLRSAVGAWAGSLPDGLLDAEDVHHLVQATASVGEADAPSLADVLRGRISGRREALAARIARLDDRLDALAASEEELRWARQRLVDEHDEPPPVPHTRAEDRADRAGAPLWRVVDFADDLDDGAQATLEAGLEAAGLLDAWVYPDGTVPDRHPQDSVLTARPPAARTSPPGAAAVPGVEIDGPTLADVLVAVVPPGLAVDAATVEAILRSVALGDAVAAVRIDGRWRLGPVSGAWTKAHAAYVGASSREAHRRRRIAELDGQLAELAQQQTVAGVERDGHTERLAAFDQAVAALPGPEAVVAARDRCERAAGQAAADRKAADSARAAHERAQQVAAERRATARRAAGQRFLPDNRHELDVVAATLGRFRDAAAALAQAVAILGERRHRLATAQERSHDAEEKLADLRSRRDVQHQRAAELRSRYETLQAAVGQEAHEVLARLEALGRELLTLADQATEAQERHTQAVGERAAAEADVTNAAEGVERAESQLAAQRAHVEVLGRPDLRSVLEVDVSEPAAVLAALDAATSDVVAGEERRKHTTTALYNGFTDLEHQLGALYHPSLDADDDVVVVVVADEDGPRPVARFAELLRQAHAEHAALLSERERQVFEDTLLASLCRQLHERITEAREQLHTMNESLRRRTTSSGLKVQLRWALLDDLPPERRAVANLLDHDPDLLDTARRDELRDHFAAEIRAARAADPGASYRALLGSVLDYRSWRSFTLRLIHPDNSERQLTKTVFSTLSGGEKATALHLPLFAAAAAHYTSALPSSPRLVALDEAFAGIDDDTQTALFGLTSEFDLDLFLTGHDLWPAHATVPSIAIYDLVHVRDAHAVHAIGVRWDGVELTEIAR
jgi:uncharacterized protein (TIGR02680 family)